MPKANSNYNLAVTKPILAKEWHIEKNPGITPTEVTQGSGKKVWWKCKEGHEWEAAIYSRSKGSGCPFCSKQNNHGFKDLASEQSLVNDWHPTKNGALNPQDVKPGYTRKIWWMCEYGHEWQATINRRLRDGGCPSCIEIDYEIDRHLFGITENHSDLSLTDHVDLMQEDCDLDLDLIDDALEFRKNRRHICTATGLLSDSKSGYLIYAKVKNYSCDGMYFESGMAFKPETTVKIKLDQPMFSFSQQKFTAIVKWCHELFDEMGATNMFGVGVRLF